MSESNDNDTAALFMDYVVEVEEHLTAAGRVLLDLEATAGRFDRGQLDGLFRNFHTVKGLSGMVGLQEAELLAHQLESYLGAVRKGRIGLSAAGLVLLIDGVRLLEQVIAARRSEASVPSVDALVGQLASILPADAMSDPPASIPGAQQPMPERSIDPHDRANAAARSGALVWQVRFAPTPARTERGLTVNVVRERLRAVGEIIHAQPTVVPGGVTFSFLVVGRTEDFPSAFLDDGLTVDRYQPPPARVPPPGTGATIRQVASLTQSNLVRVDLGRLDELMRTVGELVITRARLDNGLGRIAATLSAAESRELRETSHAMERQLRDLREGVMRVRLVPIRDVFARMRFVVRDLARETGREIDLHLAGEETEIDKFVVERLADPILHLIRNAASHGLESPAERASAGKSPRGNIELRAATAGGAVEIVVEDDGRGIDPELVFARARAAGLIGAGTATDPVGVLDLICSPGFSTRDGVDLASGRGVGMDVVARSVEELGGTLTLSTRLGQGTRFTARLPLTLAIADALILTVCGQTFAISQTAVREVVEVAPELPVVLENNELLPHRGGVLPLLHLADLFGLSRPAGAFIALIIGDGSVALAADRVLGLREIVVHSLADPLVQAPGISGAAELGDGRTVLILDAVGLARSARSIRRPTA